MSYVPPLGPGRRAFVGALSLLWSFLHRSRRYGAVPSGRRLVLLGLLAGSVYLVWRLLRLVSLTVFFFLFVAVAVSALRSYPAPPDLAPVFSFFSQLLGQLLGVVHV